MQLVWLAAVVLGDHHLKVLDLTRGHEREGDAGATSTGCAADTMHVRLDAGRGVVRHDCVHAGHVHAASHAVRAHEHAHLARPELCQHVRTLILLQGRRELGHGESAV